MTIQQREREHRWGTYLTISGKRDLSGRGMTEKQRLLLQPFHPSWNERNQEMVASLRSRAGSSLLEEAVEMLPEETYDWSPQQWCYSLERGLRVVESAPLDKQLSARDLAIAILAGPLLVHPYAMARLSHPCPKCGQKTPPGKMDGRGYIYSCQAAGCGQRWEERSEESERQWQERLERAEAMLPPLQDSTD